MYIITYMFPVRRLYLIPLALSLELQGVSNHHRHDRNHRGSLQVSVRITHTEGDDIRI